MPSNDTEELGPSNDTEELGIVPVVLHATEK